MDIQKKQEILKKANFLKSADGLLPAIVQDAVTRSILMTAFINKSALEHTFDTGKVTFFSRSKDRLWTKGEESGHFLELVDAFLDCDADAVLFLANPKGFTCHEGRASCFDKYIDALNNKKADTLFLHTLEAVIADRKVNPKPGYTSDLFASGALRIAQKFGEESIEVTVAAAAKAPNLRDEIADLFYVLTVLMQENGISYTEIMAILRARHKQ